MVDRLGSFSTHPEDPESATSHAAATWHEELKFLKKKLSTMARTTLSPHPNFARFIKTNFPLPDACWQSEDLTDFHILRVVRESYVELSKVLDRHDSRRVVCSVIVDGVDEKIARSGCVDDS
jgi:hypothetical protein